MARAGECIPRWLWHAFDALDHEKKGSAPKTELRVLTAHIGNSLGSKDSNAVANELVKKFEDEPSVGFNDYRHFLRDQQFLDVEEMDLAKLEEVSWMICGSRYEARGQPVLTQDEVYRLWRIFNFLAEPYVYPVVLDPQEATIMFEKLVVAMGAHWNDEDFQDRLEPNMIFPRCLKCFEKYYVGKVDRMCVTEGINDVYNEMIEEVEKMGQLKKKGHKVTSWKDRWFILKPFSLAYYVDKTLKEQKGNIHLTSKWRIETLPDQKGYKNLFVLFSDDTSQENTKRRYEISCPDPRTRQEWISAVENVLKRMDGGESPQLVALEKRRAERRQKLKEKQEAERLLKLQEEECERQKLQLQELEKARDEASRKAEEELALRMAKEKEEEENRRREKEERAKTQQEIDALRTAREEAEKKAKEEAAKLEAKALEEAERRRIEQEEKEKQGREMEELKKARDEASRKAEEELALRMAKEKEEEENRRREMEERAKTQQEIDALRAAREEAEKRAQEEAAKREAKALEEEERRRIEQEEKERQARELEELKKAYEDATRRAEIEERLKEEDRKRLAELEESLEQLEVLLDEERQAKRDEEIVRGLQARLLCEETEKREKLERLRLEQEEMLRLEQEKREHLEQWSEELEVQKRQQAEQLETERQRLAQLEEERKAADQKLSEAMEKLSMAEMAKRNEERKRRELEKPVGLARLIQPKANPLITHRGYGAFSHASFEIEKEMRRRMKQKQSVQENGGIDDGSPTSGSEVNGEIDDNIRVSENGMEGER